jgi:hypothetical protein
VGLSGRQKCERGFAGFGIEAFFMSFASLFENPFSLHKSLALGIRTNEAKLGG